MDDLLAPMNKITAKRGADFERQPDTLPTRSVEARSDNPKNIESPDQVSQILRNQPDLHTVSSVLNYLTSTSDSGDDFNLVTPSPVSAQVVDILVSQTVPDYWRSIEESSHLAKQIVSCLRSANGIGAIFSRLRPLIADCRQNKNVENTRDATSQIEDLIDVIEKVLSGHRTSSQIWQDIQKHSRNPTEGKLMWNEYVAQVASGRILSLVAEAESILKQKESSHPPSWLGTGKDYAAWLGRNIAILVKEAQSKDGVSAAIGQLCGKAMALGYLGLSSSVFQDII
jgi:telomere length regulation protein